MRAIIVILAAALGVAADDPQAKPPTLFIIGDSTVKTPTKGQQGWGDPIAALFDKSKIKVVNHAIGGRSSRTFQTEGRWDKVLAAAKPGDFVLIQFGHNDGGPLDDAARARGSLRGTGDETKEIDNPITKKKEVVHTYGWYMRKYVADARAKGITPIIVSPVPHSPREKVEKGAVEKSNYVVWSEEVAKAEKVPFVHLNKLAMTKYAELTPAEIKEKYFTPADGTHTSPAGAALNAACVVEGIRELKDCPLKDYLLAAEPFIDRVDLFEANAGGYKIYRIPGVVVTAKGTVLSYCEARKSDRGDWGAIDILLRRSTDGGKTWDEPRTIADVPGPKPKNPVALAQKLADPNDVTYNNPVMIADRSGAVHLLFCLEYMRCFHSRSDDEGKTWSAPNEITAAAFDPYRKEYDWKVLAAGPGHGIQLKSGRLLVPVWLSTGTGGHAHRPSVTSTIYSDDSGKTWHRGEVAIPNTAEWVNPNEATVAELPDGTVVLNTRSESQANRRLVTRSKDGATGWSKPAFDDALVEPICMGSLLAVPGEKPVLVFANPDNLERATGKVAPGTPRDRKNLTVWLSEDGGKTWPVKRAIEPGPGGYSDLAMTKDGTLLLFYERAGTDGANSLRTGRLTVARFNLDWVRAR